MSFMDLEKAYDRVTRETLWQVLRMVDVGSILLDEIKSMHVNRLACVRVKDGERECFRIDSGVRQYCIMSLWLVNGCNEEGGENGDGREWRLPGFLYTDDMALCDQSEEDLKMVVERRSSLNVKANKSNVMC